MNFFKIIWKSYVQLLPILWKISKRLFLPEVVFWLYFNPTLEVGFTEVFVFLLNDYIKCLICVYFLLLQYICICVYLSVCVFVFVFMKMELFESNCNPIQLSPPVIVLHNLFLLFKYVYLTSFFLYIGIYLIDVYVMFENSINNCI